MVQIQTYTTKRYIIHTITFHFYHLEGKINGKGRSWTKFEKPKVKINKKDHNDNLDLKL
jgi:hypothetical protein